MILLTVIFAIITTIIAKYLNILREDERLTIIYDIVKTAVYAIEQTSDGHGKVKKDAVLEYVKNQLSNSKIKYDLELLDKFIESAVFEMNSEVDYE